VAGYAVGAALPFLVFAWCGGAIRRRLPQGRSIGEFAHARFGTGVRRWVSLISVLYMLCFLTAELTAIGAIAGMLAGLAPAWPVVGVAVATLIYTTWGGLRASIVTDRWQAWLLMALLVLIGALSGYFVVPMNALLQHRGHVLMSAGHSIAVQNFSENLSILLMLGLYALLVKLDLSVNIVIVLFGLFVAGVMWLVMKKHAANQREYDSLHLIGEKKHIGT
jgi:Na+/proline symporter